MTVHKPTHAELIDTLKHYRQFARLGDNFLSEMARRMTWHFLPGGMTLFQQGEEGTSMYVVLGGRLQVFKIKDDDPVVVGEVGQGETVGELAMLTGSRRNATVTALRDTYLVRLSRAHFDTLVDAYPRLMMRVARFIMRRVNHRINDMVPTQGESNFAIVAMDDQVDLSAFCRALVDALEHLGGALHLSMERARDIAGPLWENFENNLAYNHHLGDWLNDLERHHRFLLYECDPENFSWTTRAMRQADCVIFVADRNRPLRGVPKWIEELDQVRNVGRRELVILHDHELMPSGTAAYLAPVKDMYHHHICRSSKREFKRLARLVTSRALGMALGGGGARGFAHIGVIRAFQECKVPIDLVGGTSMGGVVGAHLAMGKSWQEILEACRYMFVSSSPWDYTLPLISLARGRKFRRVGGRYFKGYDIEDMRLNYFCVSSNLSRAKQMVHRTGPLAEWLMATTALPGLLPPIFMDGEVLVDGGLFNNVPADVMDAMGRGHICAVDVSPGRDFTLQTMESEAPSPWQLLWWRLNPFVETPNVPGMLQIMVRSATLSNLSGIEAMKNHIALYLNLPMQNVGMLDWNSIDKLVELGYEHTMKELEHFDKYKGRV